MSIPVIQGNDIASPYTGQAVTTEGIVTARTVDGYFIQSPHGDSDGSDSTSEGMFVFLGMAPGAAASVGNLIRVTGTVYEHRPSAEPNQLPLTRLADITQQLVLATGQALPAPIPLSATTLGPNSDITALERLEGMRVSAAELVVVGAAGATINESSLTAVSDGVVHVVPGTYVTNSAIPFRAPGLSLLDTSTPPAGKTLDVFEGNPQVLRVDSRAQPGAPLLDLGLNDRVQGAVGVLGYAGARFSLLIDPVSPLRTTPGSRGERASGTIDGEFRIAWMDLGRLFDAQDNPALPEPVTSNAKYDARLVKLARYICDSLGNPEIIALSGAETYQVLGDLADAIETYASEHCTGTYGYRPVLVEGRDPSGLDIGFLLMGNRVDGITPRVELLDVEQIASADISLHPAGGSEPLFPQPPLRASVRVTDDVGRQVDLAAVVVKFQEVTGSDAVSPGANGWATTGLRIMTLRARQAARLAGWLQARQTSNPAESLVLLGGFESDPFNDGRVDVMGIVTGETAPASETWLSVPSPITLPLANLTDLAPPYTRYNTNDRGDFRALDHIVVNAAMRASFGVIPIHPRVNAGSPASQRVASGENFPFSSRDPLIARLAVAAFIDADTRVEFFAPDDTSSLADNIFYATLGNDGPDAAKNVAVAIVSDLPVGSWSVSTQWPGWYCTEAVADIAGSRVDCRLDTLAVGTQDRLDILVPADPDLDGVTANFTTELTGSHNDSDRSNNRSAGAVTFDNRTDVGVLVRELPGQGKILPGDSGNYLLEIEQWTTNPTGPMSIVVTLDAPVAESMVSSSDSIDCGAGVDIGPRKSRRVCELAAGRSTGATVIEYKTSLGDGGRVVGVTVEAYPTRADRNPADNVASIGTRVSDDVDMVVGFARLSPSTGTLDADMTLAAQVTNTVMGVARNATLEILVDVPPEVLGPVVPTAFTVFGVTVNWTCNAPAATPGGSRVLCQAPALLDRRPSFRPEWVFRATFRPVLKPGLTEYPITASFNVRSDSVELAPGNNAAVATATVDQTTDLSVLVRGPDTTLLEPRVASFEIDVSSAASANRPRNARAMLELNAEFATNGVQIRDSNLQPVACNVVAAPAGRTHLDCPIGFFVTRSLRVDVPTGPSLAGRSLELKATVSNDLLERSPANNVASASVSIIAAVADLCVGRQCGVGLPLPPAKINAGGINSLRYPFFNIGTSTAVDANLTIELAVPAARLSARVDDMDCAGATDIGGGKSRVVCLAGDLVGNGEPHELTINLDASGLGAGNLPLSIEASSPVTENSLANNRLEFILPVAPLMDLSIEVTSKSARYPGVAGFAVLPTADGPPNAALSEVFLRVDAPGTFRRVEVGGTGWQCGSVLFSATVTSIREYVCVRATPLSGGTAARLNIWVPLDGFAQIGRDIKVFAEHYYRPEALANDRTPGNNSENHARRVEGRSTKALRTPAYGGRPAVPTRPPPTRSTRTPVR